MIKVIVFNWNALDRLDASAFVDVYHDMAVRECKIIEAGYELVTDHDQQCTYVEVKDDLEAVEFKLRFF
jgi:hypothetical protein